MSKHLILMGLCAVIVTGCKRELTVKQTVPVKGKVLFANGEPVRWAQINLLTKDPNVGANCRGVVGDDGTFEVRTYSSTDCDGATPGVYDVQIEPYDPVVAGPLPKNANSPTPVPKDASNGVTIEIKADGDNQNIQIKLTK